MKRLVVAAVLAVALHALLLWADGPASKPVMLAPRNRTVDISLVAFHKPVEKPRPTATPKAAPKPEPKPAPKPKPKPKPAPVTPNPKIPVKIQPVAKEHIIEPIVPEAPDAAAAADTAMVTPLESPPPARTDAAAVQVSVPRYDINPPPQYPRQARRRNYEGVVLLDVRVTAEGTVAELKVTRSSGHAVLDDSALKAVRRWRFTPARRGSRPIESWVEVPVRFELH